MWRPCRLLVGLVLGSSATAVAGYAAGAVSQQLCDLVDLAISGGGSISQVLSNSGFSNPLPPGCNLDSVYAQVCTDAGLACKDQFVLPTLPSLTGSIDVTQIEEYETSIQKYADCWGDDGGLRPTVTCTDPSIFQSLQQELDAAKTSIEVAITSVQTKLDDARESGASTVELQSQLEALQLAATSVTAAEALTAHFLAGDDPSDSTNSGGGSSGENSGGDGGGEVDAGVVAGAVVGGIAGVGLVVYVLDKTNVITLPPFPAVTSTHVNVASAFYSEEASAFI